MNNIYFENVPQIGSLYMDYVFYQFESEPILFTCVDDKKELYICICSDIRYGQKWLVTKCSIDTLKALVEEKMDIASAFLISETSIMVTMDLQGNESSYVIDRENIDKLDLPKEGTFMRCNKQKVQNYLDSKKHNTQFLHLYSFIGNTGWFYEIVDTSCKSSMSESPDMVVEVTVIKALRENSLRRLSKYVELPDKSIHVNQSYTVSVKKRYIDTSDTLNLCPVTAAYFYAA